MQLQGLSSIHSEDRTNLKRYYFSRLANLVLSLTVTVMADALPRDLKLNTTLPKLASQALIGKLTTRQLEAATAAEFSRSCMSVQFKITEQVESWVAR